MRKLRIKHTLRVVLASQKEQIRSETAFLANFWADVLTAIIYVVTQTVFIDLLFRRAGLIAGYSRNDFFFLMFVNQFTYFSTTRLLALPMFLLVDSVRFGHFDLMMLRPVPLRAYLYARAIKPISTLLAAVPSLLIFGAMIDWSRLNIGLSSVILGIIVWISGYFIFRTFIFALAYPVFTEGDATDSLSGFFWTASMNQMPYQNLPQFMKVLSLFIIPTLLMTAGTVAVILMKGTSATIVVSSVAASLLLSIVFKIMWKRALNNYSSASS
ncbi:MAG: ABC-2 family transporter protein [Candidatus Saccharibacteria bacterium]|nr:ABC-2 family transporter protein [Candidatus Saccharibacteria bacterium]